MRCDHEIICFSDWLTCVIGQPGSHRSLKDSFKVSPLTCRPLQTCCALTTATASSSPRRWATKWRSCPLLKARCRLHTAEGTGGCSDDVTQCIIIIIIIIGGRWQKQCFRVRDRPTLCKRTARKKPQKRTIHCEQKKEGRLYTSEKYFNEIPQ